MAEKFWYAKDLPEICLRYFWNCNEVCIKSKWYITELCLRFFFYILRYDWDMSQIFLRFVQDKPDKYLHNTWISIEIWKKFEGNFSEKSMICTWYLPVGEKNVIEPLITSKKRTKRSWGRAGPSSVKSGIWL